MVGEGEEVADGLGGDLPAAEGGGDLLEGGGEGGETLGLPAVEEGLGGVEEGPGSDEDVVGLVVGGAQAGGGLGEEDARRADGLGRDGEVAVSGLGAEAEGRPGLVAGEPGDARGEVEESGGGGDPGDLGRPGNREDAVEGPGARGSQLGIEDVEAVEEDAGGDARVAHVRDAQLVRRREERDRHVRLQTVRHGAVEGLLGHEGPVEEELDVVVHDGDGVGAALEVDHEPGGLGRGGVEAFEGEGLGLAHAGAEGLPLPEVLDVEDVGSVEAVGLEGGDRTRGNAVRSVHGGVSERHPYTGRAPLEGIDRLRREGRGGGGRVHVEEEPAPGPEGGALGQDEEGDVTRGAASAAVTPRSGDRDGRRGVRSPGQSQRGEVEGPGASGEEGLEGDGVQALV